MRGFMKRVPFFLIVLFLSGTGVFPQAIGGLAEEYGKLEEYLRNQKQTPEEKKKILEANVLNSLRSTLAHRLVDPKKELKDLKFQDVQTERLDGTNKLFVKYKNYYIAYLFSVDPESFLISPIEENLLERPVGANLNAAHQDEKSSVIPK